MNRNNATNYISKFEKWRRFLESTAASLRINLVYLNGAAELFSVYNICPACGKTLQTLDITSEISGVGTAAPDGNKVQEIIGLDEKYMVAVRGFPCCRSGGTLSFREKAGIAKNLLTKYYNILFYPLYERHPVQELTALRHFNHIVLSMIRDNNSALERAIDLILSAAVILVEAGGSWFDYTAAGKSRLLTKGKMNAATESGPLSICKTVAVDMHSPVFRGTLGLISPVDHKKAVIFLDYLANECVTIFEIDKLMMLTEAQNLVHASTLLSTVAHEIRNPMATLIGLLQIIELKGGTPEISKYVGIGMNEIRKITLLLDEVSQTGKTAEATLEKSDEPGARYNAVDHQQT